MLNIVLFFFLLDKGDQPIVGGYAEHDYTHDIQQVGEVDNPFNDDKPYAPTGIFDGRLFEQLVSPIFVYRPFFRGIRGSFYSHVLFTMRTVYQVDGQKYEEDRNEEQDYGKYRKEHAANSEKSGYEVQNPFVSQVFHERKCVGVNRWRSIPCAVVNHVFQSRHRIGVDCDAILCQGNILCETSP